MISRTRNTSELLMPHFYKQHVCRLEEWPDPVNRALKHANGVVYTLMQGPSEFGIGGRLTNWDRKADLPKITGACFNSGRHFRYDGSRSICAG